MSVLEQVRLNPPFNMVDSQELLEWNRSPYIGYDNTAKYILYRQLPNDISRCLLLSPSAISMDDNERLLELIESSKSPYDIELAELMHQNESTRHIMKNAHEDGSLRAVDNDITRVYFGKNVFLSLDEVIQLIKNNPYVDFDKYINNATLPDPFASSEDKNYFVHLIDKLDQNQKPLTWFERVWNRITKLKNSCFPDQKNMITVYLDRQYTIYSTRRIRQILTKNLDWFNRECKVKRTKYVDGKTAIQLVMPNEEYGFLTHGEIEEILDRELIVHQLVSFN